MRKTNLMDFDNIFVRILGFIMTLPMLVIFPHSAHSEGPAQTSDEMFFTLENDIDLRSLGGANVGDLLTRVKGKGSLFGEKQRKRYCELTENAEQVQWVLNNLESGEVISKSPNADKLFFGASVSKLFVAAALLNKQKGQLEKVQMDQLVRMIVVSDNHAWKELQRQVGDDGSNDSGREAIDEFVQQMGYTKIKGFQGWLRKEDGTRIHGNELNALQLSSFLYDTYQRNYEGAEVLWKVMHATRTGKSKIDKYTPSTVYIGGKTGTYHGPNVSPETIQQPTIKARNHAAVLKIDDRYYGLSIFTNTGSNEDVAILGGGLMREHLGVGEGIDCL
jgi:hypothetical protein